MDYPKILVVERLVRCTKPFPGVIEMLSTVFENISIVNEIRSNVIEKTANA